MNCLFNEKKLFAQRGMKFFLAIGQGSLAVNREHLAVNIYAHIETDKSREETEVSKTWLKNHAIRLSANNSDAPGFLRMDPHVPTFSNQDCSNPNGA